MKNAEVNAGVKMSMIIFKTLAVIVFLAGLFTGTYFAKVAREPNYFLGCMILAGTIGLSKELWNVK